MKCADLTMPQSQWLRSMHERFPVLFGFVAQPEEQRYELPAGWRGLVEDAADELTVLDVDVPVIGRLKEKMGTLRIQLMQATPDAYDIVRRAEARSLTTCAECGMACDPVPEYSTPCCAGCALG